MLRTPVACTEGVLVMGDFAYLGGFCPPAVQGGLLVSVDLRSLGTNGTLSIHSTLGPDPVLNNLVAGVANSSFRSSRGSTAAAMTTTEPLPPIFFGSVSDDAVFSVC